MRRQLRRSQIERFFSELAPVVVGMEACGGAHHWGRVLRGLGHEVRLMPPAYVKPYARRNKTDGHPLDVHGAPLRPEQRWPRNGAERMNPGLA